MPVTVTEKWESRETTLSSGNDSSVTLIFVIDGTDDDLVANAALLAATPTSYNGLIRQNSHVERTGQFTWEGSIRYGTVEPAETGSSTFSFDTAGGTQHITQSIETIASYAPPSETAPDFKGAIGVTHDSVEGVDITVPVYNFTETHYIADALVTLAYRVTLFNLTGKVNDATFRGLASGEVLFLGASGSKRGLDDWEITFRFAGSANRTGLTVGDITGIDKKGWEYFWVRYADAEDATAKVLVKKPQAVYIEKVYDLADFTLLGIGS